MSELNLLTLICPPELDERLLDRLLVAYPAELFTSRPVACHGGAHHTFDPAEQVLGRRQAVQVQILLPTADVSRLLADLRDEFTGVGLRYWMHPLAAAGELT